MAVHPFNEYPPNEEVLGILLVQPIMNQSSGAWSNGADVGLEVVIASHNYGSDHSDGSLQVLGDRPITDEL